MRSYCISFSVKLILLIMMSSGFIHAVQNDKISFFLKATHIYVCLCTCCVLSCFSRVWLLEIPWTVALQAPLSMVFFRQEYWSGLPFRAPSYSEIFYNVLNRWIKNEKEPDSGCHMKARNTGEDGGSGCLMWVRAESEAERKGRHKGETQRLGQKQGQRSRF